MLVPVLTQNFTSVEYSTTCKVPTVYTPIVDPSLLQDLPLKIQIEDPSKSNQRQ